MNECIKDMNHGIFSDPIISLDCRGIKTVAPRSSSKERKNVDKFLPSYCSLVFDAQMGFTRMRGGEEIVRSESLMVIKRVTLL